MWMKYKYSWYHCNLNAFPVVSFDRVDRRIWRLRGIIPSKLEEEWSIRRVTQYYNIAKSVKKVKIRNFTLEMNSIGSILHCWNAGNVWCVWNHAVLFQNLSHNLIKSEFHVQTDDLFSSIKFEITMNLEQFYWVIQNDCE
jgi:hypothetical protein